MLNILPLLSSKLYDLNVLFEPYFFWHLTFQIVWKYMCWGTKVCMYVTPLDYSLAYLYLHVDNKPFKLTDTADGSVLEFITVETSS